MAASYTTVVIVAVIENRFRLLAVLLVLPHIAVFGLVNPVDRGLRVVESAPLFRFVRARPELLRHRWIVYSASPRIRRSFQPLVATWSTASSTCPT